jgi:flagellar motor switch protein FliN/FliY
MIIDIGTSIEHAGEIAPDTLLTSVTGEFAAVAILENDVCVACVVIRTVDDSIDREVPAPHVTPIPAASVSPVAPALSSPDYEPDDVLDGELDDETARREVFEPTYEEPVNLPALASVTLARHEFQPLADGPGPVGPARPLSLLNEVNMEVTAELGRRRLKVRDIVALRPGSVVELDRAAGSPVDVLVNGALVWHGEVVIVDEEFGIRVSEIVVDEN